jgi:hypothetical protein
MLDVVCWLWRPTKAYRSQFAPEHVNTLRRMVERHYRHPHRFSCITDQTEGFDPDVRIIPLWSDYRDRQSIYGPDTPACYPRLKAFCKTMREVIGPRFISLDLDVCITGDVTPVFQRREDFLIWGVRGRRTPWNGSMWMMDAGARDHVWTRFNENPDKAVVKARGAGYYGSDQAWMNYVLGPDENNWSDKDGVYSFRMNIKPNGGHLPPDARIVFFEGHYDPWSPATQKICPWVTEYYR